MMCMECLVQAKTLLTNVVPGYNLCVATNDECPDWPRDDYALTDGQEPVWVFRWRPLPDPYDGWPDDEIESERGDELHEDFQEFAKIAEYNVG